MGRSSKLRPSGINPDRQLPESSCNLRDSMDEGDRLTLAGGHLTTVQQLARAVAIPRIELTVEKEAGQEVGRKVVLEGDIFKLGSHASNDLVVADRLVSRFHC